MAPDTSAPEGGTPKAAVKRRRLDAADARESILAAAEGLLVDGGPDALRLTEVATRAGVSHPNVLYHFGSVSELQAQLAQRVAVRLAGEMAQVFAQGMSGQMPLEQAIDAVFRVFDEGGFARLLAWLELSKNEPTFEALASKLELLRKVISSHPALQGEENARRRRRVVPVIELVIVSAIGYGLVGRTVDTFFIEEEHRPSVARLLRELIAAGAGFPAPATTTTSGAPKA
jgi:TetR/AcrR family transcriptional regulator, repressor for neighboring sulfatase